MRGGNTSKLSNIFKNDQAKGHVLPEEPCIKVESYFLSGLVNWQHGERHPAVANVGIENSLETALIRDLPIIHALYSIFNWHHLVQVKARVFFQESLTNELDFIIKILNFICTCLIETLIQEWHVLSVEGGLAIPVLEEAIHSSRVNDLITRAKSQG